MAALAPWKDVIQGALKKNRQIKGANYFQIGTIKPNGRPANRTVVFRDWLNNTDRFTFITDIRSNKVSEVKENPYAEIAWWFPQTRDQFRISAKLDIITSSTKDEALQAARQQTWSRLKDAARQQFLWPHPAEPRQEAVDDSNIFCPEPPSPDSPVDTFCLVVVDVDQVDHLCLKGNKRWLYTRQQAEGEGLCSWTKQYVNP
uniref:Pyridoxamine 5'-phosphate oxidase Alr4036 family FMN-binding domain-containing protein n=1 Tax=Dunaliella tertiolecta TaxID=3047 RepID=A0A7S3RAT0_DUNTE|mmetsp:Transcript_6126/g.14643  ORF Transcript_6126/g.14643 Transcript_6126/m.14643 type:complete len:202 (+) Transcript_6126:69-674(+)